MREPYKQIPNRMPYRQIHSRNIKCFGTIRGIMRIQLL